MRILCLITLCIITTTHVVADVSNGPEPKSNLPPQEIQLNFQVEKYMLDNGLTVLLHEDKTLPIVSYQTWFRVGSRNEEPGYTGIAHLFEHMMFKGAKRYSGKEFNDLLHANGVTNNAFTTHDFTGYYENLPSDKLELIVDLESDRMENLNITEEHLRSEREVVKEERRYRVDNDVRGLLMESTWSSVFKVHPYRWPVIGFMRDLNNITVEKCTEFFRQYYAPNNAVIVIAGSFDPGQAKSLLKKYYGKIPAQKIQWTKIPKEPDQHGQRLLTQQKDVRNATFNVAYRGPQAGSDDAFSLDLLASILGDGDSSRLYKILVYKKQTVTDVSASNYTPKDPGVFQVMVSVRPGVERGPVARDIYSQIWKLQNQLVEPAELIKAKNLVLKSYVDSLKTVSGKAHTLALNEILFGDYSAFFKDIGRYQRVTAEDIKQVANKYLKPEQRSVIIVSPKKTAANGQEGA